MRALGCEIKLLAIAMSLWSIRSFLIKFPIRATRNIPLQAGKSMYSLMMDTPVLLRGLGEIADRYDLFLFDQFGVLHDGATPVTGTIRMLEQLQKLNKTSIIVSNTSNRSKIALKRLIDLGFSSSFFEGGVVTSGESAHRWIDSLCLAGGKRKCCFITWRDGKAYKAHGEHSFLAELNVEIATAEEADFILFHGTQSIASIDSELIGTPITLYEDGDINQEILQDCLKEAARRGIPAICANLDMIAMVPTGAAHMPGMLKLSYEDMGGSCVGFGKPNKGYFELAVEMASAVHREKYGIGDNVKLRAIHIGDSVHHDIAGASAARLDSILITGDGIHKRDLENTRSTQELTNYGNDIRYAASTDRKGDSEPLDKSLLTKVCDLCDKEKIARPTFILEHCTY